MGRGTAGRRPVVEGPATRAPAPAPPSRAFGTRHLPIGSADREGRHAPPKILPVTRKRHGEGDRRPQAGGGGASRRSPPRRPPLPDRQRQSARVLRPSAPAGLPPKPRAP